MLHPLILLLAAAALAFAQTTGTATLVGTVTDAQGAVVPGAKVVVRNTGTSFVHESVTSPEGTYYVPYLSPGDYELIVEGPGFKRYVRSGIILRTGETPRINVQLELGSVTESITVDAAPPLLETETAQAGQILGGDTVVKIPVMQKFVHRVLLYMPGMTNINGQHALGQRQRSLGYTLDGVSGKEPVVGQVGDFRRTMIASLDSIQEFKLSTTGTPAEVGHSGSSLSAVFRGGTNSFHGSVEDRYTNGKLIHRQYFEQLPRTGAFDYHEWGATAGGPIVRNKTFFFFGFQQHYEELSETFIGDVPSPQMYDGNFDFGPNSFPIYDPATTRRDEAGNWIRDVFPGNRIPQSRFDPVALNLLSENPWKEQTVQGILTP
ncbi:MAG: carboxypeptidase-like regulatory domain-containing protein, partial [Bryobacteraceae bacterium]